MKLIILFLLCCSTALAADPIRPDPKLTPGAVLTISLETLCAKGYVRKAKARAVTDAMKKEVFIRYFGRVPARPGAYEIDHLISLELGGANTISNLWPQSYTGPWNARVKDRLEQCLARLLRADLKKNGHDHATALLTQFQFEISRDWIAAYSRYVKPVPSLPK